MASDLCANPAFITISSISWRPSRRSTRSTIRQILMPARSALAWRGDGIAAHAAMGHDTRKMHLCFGLGYIEHDFRPVTSQQWSIVFVRPLRGVTHTWRRLESSAVQCGSGFSIVGLPPKSSEHLVSWHLERVSGVLLAGPSCDWWCNAWAVWRFASIELHRD